jgi:hypothetical protein
MKRWLFLKSLAGDLEKRTDLRMWGIRFEMDMVTMYQDEAKGDISPHKQH